ncbi:MAG TPA: peptidylprolyl isomerase [Acidobacteria bacterium]|nr:peptidylprolyl isomerase [Acidobacteriota bacterium]
MNETTTIANDTVVSIEYTLTDDEGEVLDSSVGAEPLSYLHGHDQIIPGLERELEGKNVGDELSLHIAAADAYGEHDPERMVEVDRGNFDFDVKEGDYVQAQHPDGSVIPFLVAEVGENTVTLDGNHPLAGKALNFEVKVVAVRPATEEERTHGHAH